MKHLVVLAMVACAMVGVTTSAEVPKLPIKVVCNADKDKPLEAVFCDGLKKEVANTTIIRPSTPTDKLGFIIATVPFEKDNILFVAMHVGYYDVRLHGLTATVYHGGLMFTKDTVETPPSIPAEDFTAIVTNILEALAEWLPNAAPKLERLSDKPAKDGPLYAENHS